ncbi:MAG TPA: hypothetical protein VFU79_01365 [Nitrososphaeraceae archaeon]|nr:hypothetical protein [Nitrososphaeraceae archaeon]
MFEKKGRKNWKGEYEDTIYKIYDWNNNLAGYFYPLYNIQRMSEMEEEEIIVRMNENKEKVQGGHLMVPFLKLDLLDIDNLDIDEAISRLQINIQRAIAWKKWIDDNKDRFNLTQSFVSTSREDRNLLAVLFMINKEIILDEKRLVKEITPLLDQLHMDELL